MNENEAISTSFPGCPYDGPNNLFTTTTFIWSFHNGENNWPDIENNLS